MVLDQLHPPQDRSKVYGTAQMQLCAGTWHSSPTERYIGSFLCLPGVRAEAQLAH